MRTIRKIFAALLVAALALSGLAALAEGKVTTTAYLRLRAGAGTGYAVRDVVDKGVTLTYDKSAKDSGGTTWYRVTYRGQKGWVCGRYVKSGGGSAGGKVTTTGDVYLRSGAGLGYASRGIVWEGTTLSYDKTAKDGRGVTWYHVSYNGKNGWISSKYARTGSGGGTKVRTTGSANVRRGPGLDYSIIGAVQEGTSLTYTGDTRKDDRGVAWYSVRYQGKAGWVSSKYAKLK